MKINYLDLDNRPNKSHDPFRTLIECILSHRTRTSNAIRAADNLFEIIESPEEILAMDIQYIKNAIRCSGFYNQKSRTIQHICKTLVQDFNGKVPKKRTTLMAINGIGPKTADIVLSYAFNQPTIAIDVHVSRVAKRLGLVHYYDSLEIVKETLEDLIDSSLYRFVDNALVKHGKMYCRKNNPHCSKCFLNHICVYFKTHIR